MRNADDPFSGTWKLNPEKSDFDPNHRPSTATMRWERTDQGYRMIAEGIGSDGRVVKENPQIFILDGEERPVSGAPEYTAVATSPGPNSIQAEGRKGGKVVGSARYVVSADGTTLTATVSGIDAQHRPFQTKLVWDRVEFAL